MHREDADGPAHGAERDVKPSPSGERLRATARRLIVLPGPRRCRGLRRPQLRVRGIRGARHEAPTVRQQDGRCGAERLGDVRNDRAAQLLDGRRAGDRTAEGIERCCAGFAAARSVGLITYPGGQMARQDGDDEEGPEREVVLRVRHPQRVEGLREEEIVDQDAQHGGEDRCLEATHHGAQQDGGEEEHAGIPQRQHGHDTGRREAGRRHQRGRERVDAQ